MLIMNFFLVLLPFSVPANAEDPDDGAAHPRVTPRAELHARADISTLGWFAGPASTGQTTCAEIHAASHSITNFSQDSPWTFDAALTTYSSSGNFIRRCPRTTSCVMYTGCSSGFMLAAATSAYCGTGGSTGTATDYCSSHLLLPYLGAATGTQTWMWCDSDLLGMTFYAREPSQPPRVTSLTSALSYGTTDSSKTSIETVSSTPTTSPVPVGGKTPVAVIVGAVVGGAAILAILIGIILWVKRRDKKKKETGYHDIALQHTPQTPHFPSSHRNDESKPLVLVQNNPEGVYNHTTYDPYPGRPTDIQRPQEMSGDGVERPPVEMFTDTPVHKPRVG